VEPVKKKSKFQIITNYVFLGVVIVTLGSGLKGMISHKSETSKESAVVNQVSTPTPEPKKEFTITDIEKEIISNIFTTNNFLAETIFTLSKDKNDTISVFADKAQYNFIFDDKDNLLELRILFENKVDLPLSFKKNKVNRDSFDESINIVNEYKNKPSEPVKNNEITSTTKEKIDKLFNPWSGAHINLVKIIKKDYEGLEFHHVYTGYQYDEATSQITIFMKFKIGDNNTMIHTTAISDLDGNILDYKTEI